MPVMQDGGTVVMVQFPMILVSDRQRSEMLTSLLDEARDVLDRDLGAALAYVERAAQLIEYDRAHTRAPTPFHRPPAQGRGGLAPWQMMRVVRYIDANLEHGTSNDRLACEARLSRSYFSKAFRVSFGQSPHNYVIERRVERAQQLMQTTTEPLSRIAHACGFADQAHLARVFRRVVGQAPNLWRCEHRQQPAPGTRSQPRTEVRSAV
jgi:transcriptional regulator GlxA family with amidase domain